MKIGYQSGIKLLHALVPDSLWSRVFAPGTPPSVIRRSRIYGLGRRLEIFGLDLRHTPSVEAFCYRHLLATRTRLDFIVNNACQTVRRPPDFYRHMLEREHGPLHNLPEAARRLLGAYEGLRGYHILPEAADSTVPAPVLLPGVAAVAGITHAAALSQVPLLPEELAAQQPAPTRAGWIGYSEVDLREAQFLAAIDGRGVFGGIAGGSLVNTIAAVSPQCPAQAADAAHPGTRQAHC